MKKLITIILVICSFQAISQVYQRFNTYGWNPLRLKVETALIFPTYGSLPAIATVTNTSVNNIGAVVYVTGDSTFYGWSGNQWRTLGGGGSGTVNSGNQYRLAHYATTGAAVSEAAAITGSRLLVSDANGLPTHSTVTTTEAGRLSGVTSLIQTQINSKEDTLYKRYYNIKKYGAVGDNSTDNTVAIQNTINICHAAGGGTVYIPTGIFKTHSITWYEDVALKGDGNLKSELRAISGLETMLTLNAFNTYAFNMAPVEDIRFNGNFTGGYGMSMRGAAHFSFKRCTWMNFQYGAFLNGSLVGMFDECSFTNGDAAIIADSATVAPIGILAPNLVTFENCVFLSFSYAGIIWRNGAGLRLESCDMEFISTSNINGSAAIMIEKGAYSGQDPLALIVNGCWFEQIHKNAINIESLVGTFTEVSISNCEAIGMGFSAKFLRTVNGNTKGLHINMNNVVLPVGSNISLDGLLTQLDLQGCTNANVTLANGATFRTYEDLFTNGWKLGGNAGISPVSNFIGTTDNKSLRFRTNNIERLYIDSNSGNVSIGTRVGLGLAVPLSKLHIRSDGIAIQNDSTGIYLQDSTLASPSNQKLSPAIVLAGQGWKTTATAASQDVRFRQDVLPIEGAANPKGTWQLASSINGGSYTNKFSVSSDGVIATANTYSGANTFASGFLVNNTYMDVVGVHAGLPNINTAASYRNTNGGSDLTPQFITVNGAVLTAGQVAYGFDLANGFLLTAANGTRLVARAGINIANLTNTAGSESGDMILLTQSAGTAMSEKLRIGSTGGVSIGSATTAAASSILDVTSVDKGFLLPRMTSTQRDGIVSPANGLMVYSTTTNRPNFYNGTYWQGIAAVTSAFSTSATAQSTFTITIGFTQANTNYRVNVTPTSSAAAVSFYVTNKTTTTFDVICAAALTGTVSFDWALFQ